ncbi:hypothetical protein BDV33DRAFT_185465 [Aspergillus novoparasiticus]|uniref:Uncharacterized protein n=1 Tax=Aspergillus novoparasiticus TaxID=986946 RepID=A0A5N6E697_9EURO|nr:hypothetical protein BDV33DRAFT_185465 [Aspergillus novoparasiticus]
MHVGSQLYDLSSPIVHRISFHTTDRPSFKILHLSIMSWLRAFIDWLGCGDSDLTPSSVHGLIYEETTTTTVKHDNTENIISESRITVMTKDLTTDSVSDRSTLVGNTGEASITEAPTRPSSPFDNCPVTLQHIRLSGDTILLPDPDLSETMGETGMEHKYHQ